MSNNRPPPPQTYQQQQLSSPKPTPKINPSQIPRPPSFNYPLLQQAQIYRTKYNLDSNSRSPNINPTTATTLPPPMSSSRFITIDDGNASPRFLRCSTHSFPKNASTQSKTGIPLSLLCTPMAIQHHYHSIHDDDNDDFDAKESSESIPPLLNGLVSSTSMKQSPSTYNFNYNSNSNSSHPQIQIDSPPLKCKRCHAYINSFVIWNQQRTRTSGHYNSYECIFCGAVNSVAEAPPMAALKKGTVEYLVNGSYIDTHNISENGNNPDCEPLLKRNIHLYALDCSFIETKPKHQNSTSSTFSTDISQLWNQYLNCITDVAERLNDVFDDEMKSRDWSLDNTHISDLKHQYRPRVGFCFILPNDTIAIPYFVGNHNKDCDQGKEILHQFGKENVKLAIMSDIYDDPFTPLPVSMWTHDVTSDFDMKVMHFIMSTVPLLLNDQISTRREGSCGGSALALMANALNETGGRYVYPFIFFMISSYLCLHH